MKKTLLTLFAATACAVSAYAIPAKPGLISLPQPDGSLISTRLMGDEFLSYTTTADGYTIERNEDGYFVYVQKVGASLVRTDVVAHDAHLRSAGELQLLQSLQKGLVADDAVKQAVAERGEAEAHILSTRTKAASTKNYDYSNFRGLVLLVEFNDMSFSRPDIKDVFSNMISQRDYKGVPSVDNPENIRPYTGSVRDYFYDSSLGKFDPEFDVVGPFKINMSAKDIKKVSNIGNALTLALNAADPEVNFSDYDRDGDGIVDMFFIVFAGYGSHTGNDAGYVWPHASYKYKYMDGVYTYRYACSTELSGLEIYGDKTLDGIGVICHEFSHVLGLVDEYDTDYNTNGQSFDPGTWSLMASSGYLNESRTPAAYSALQRMQAGFSYPTRITEPGEYTLPKIEDSGASFRIESGSNKEYFLFENRSTDTKWDAFLAGSGMLAFRVDSTSTSPWKNNIINANASHNYYELLRAKPSIPYTDSSSDPFPGSAKVTKLNNSTKPANLVAWTGKKCPLAISNITRNEDGSVSFSVGKDYFGYKVEDFEAMTAGEDKAEGVFTSWSFNNAAVGSYGSTKGNGDKSVKISANGEVIMHTVNSQVIEDLELTVWYSAMSGKATITVSLSTDDGATWNEIFTRDTTEPNEVSAGAKGVVLPYAIDAEGKAMIKISSNKTLYLDDVTLFYNDPNGLTDVETVKIGGSKKAPFAIATIGNAIEVISESNAPIEVFDAAGQLVTRTTATTITLPGRGFYIVRQGNASQKVTL